jgi:hypothetical protein
MGPVERQESRAILESDSHSHRWALRAGRVFVHVQDSYDVAGFAHKLTVGAAKAVAQYAAVIGRQFSGFQAVSQLDEAMLA